MSRVGEHRPLYVAEPKKKQKMPASVRSYFACITKGESKGVCRKKHLSGEKHGEKEEQEEEG